MEKKYNTVARFPGIIKKVQTMSSGDGAFRITIDIPENAAEAIMELMKIQSSPQICAIVVAKEIVPVEHLEEDDKPF